VEQNEYLLWCPGQEPFDLNVDNLIAVIQSRREEESPVWGGLQLQDAVAANLETMEDDFIMNDDQEEEDGMYTLKTTMSRPTSTNGHDRRTMGSGSGSVVGSFHGSIDSRQSLGRNPLHLQRRPPHPSRDRRQSESSHSGVMEHGNADTGDPAHPPHMAQGQPENWTFLDVDIFRVPSSVNNGPSLLSGRGWPDMSVLRSFGSAVGGAAVGLVQGAAAQSPRLTAYRSRNQGIAIPSISGNSGGHADGSGSDHYPNISSSAP